jgi:hypothetical protein
LPTGHSHEKNNQTRPNACHGLGLELKGFLIRTRYSQGEIPGEEGAEKDVQSQ